MNPLHPVVPIEIGGHTFTLRYEYRDFAKAEGRLDKALFGPASESFWASGTAAYKLSVLLYVGLLNCERRVLIALYPQIASRPSQLDLDDVMGLLTFQNSLRIETKVADALRKFQPELTPSEQKEAEQSKGAPADESPLAEPSGGTSTTPSAEPPSA